MTDVLPVPADAISGAATVDARRIGLIGDDHNAEDDGGDLPDEALQAFDGVDLILHLGHMGVRQQLARGVLDRLADVAPVVAIRDYSTDQEGKLYVTPGEGARVSGVTRVIESHDWRIGAVHNPARPPGPAIPTPAGGFVDPTGIDLNQALVEMFGRPVDIVAYASTHRPVALTAQGVLFVNPGSPTYPRGPWRPEGQRSLGTVGILDLTESVAAFEIVELSLFRGEGDG